MFAAEGKETEITDEYVVDGHLDWQDRSEAMLEG